MEKQVWEMTREQFRKEYENGVVYGDTYITGYGEPIKIGEEIVLQFAGSPVKFPLPWKLADAKNEYSTVNHKNNVTVTIESATGERRAFPFAHWHSPSGKKAEEFFGKFIKAPLSNDDHATLIKLALSDEKPVPPEVLAEYPDLASRGHLKK